MNFYLSLPDTILLSSTNLHHHLSHKKHHFLPTVVSPALSTCHVSSAVLHVMAFSSYIIHFYVSYGTPLKHTHKTLSQRTKLIEI